jgi:mono/diheme cytochrome c family protein
MEVGAMWKTRSPDGALFCGQVLQRFRQILWPSRAVIAVFGSALLAWVLGVASPGETRAQDTSLETGKIAYLRECAGCHGVTGLGDGPDVPFFPSVPTDLRRSGVLDVQGNEALRARIRDGRSLAVELRPEALRSHAQETERLYEFMVRIPGIAWDEAAVGQDLYLSRCLSCHDRYGHPVAEPMKGVRKSARDLADPAFQRAVTDEELHVLARHGKAAMPALVPRLRQEEVGPLVSFIRVLSPGYETYSRYCDRCHGMGETDAGDLFAELGAAQFAFDKNYFATRVEDDIRAAIWHMLRDAKPQMPHFAASLSTAELDAILGYLRSLPTLSPTQNH